MRNISSRFVYRAGGVPLNLVLPPVPVVDLDRLLLTPHRGHDQPATLDFVKIDVDGPEGAWMSRIDELMSADRLRIRTIVVECHQCPASLLHRMQSYHKYNIFLLDMHMDKRFLDSRGVDVYSNFQDTQLPWFIDELYSIRFMRHVYAYKPGMTIRDWSLGQRLVRMYCNQYVLTQEQLLEPRREHQDANCSVHGLLCAREDAAANPVVV
jgi:hypothetical protein